MGTAGAPGPVSVSVDSGDDVSQRVRVTNIEALSRKEGFDPIAEMVQADPAIHDLLESGEFTFLTVNDGDLAVQAGANLYGAGYNTVGDAINGSGTGGAIACRDTRFEDQEAVFHPLSGPWEVGHTPHSLDFPSQTSETTISGIAIEKSRGIPVEELDERDPAFLEVGTGLARVIINMGVLGGAELVVMSGGIGIGSQDTYKEELLRQIDRFANSTNPMADKTPVIKFPPKGKLQTYEMHGARKAILSHLTRRAIDSRIRAAD